MCVILLDDVGFGASSAFGGPCQTPTGEYLAANGLKYNRFHTTALCSPTRQALLTGRNHHSAGMGGITEIATGAPGYNSVLPNTMSPITRTLKLNGYDTAQFGKCHEVPESGAEGVIIAQGANIGGWSLYAKDGTLNYCYNLGGVQHFYVEATSPLSAGEHQVRMEFAYEGEGLGKGGTVTLYTDGEMVGEGTVEAALPSIFSADDGCDIGQDTGAPVSPDYGPSGNAFNGRVKGVQIAIADAAEAGGPVISRTKPSG